MGSHSNHVQSSSWLGALTRSVSGSLSLSDAKTMQSDHGVELAPLSKSCTGLTYIEMATGVAVSQPICVRGLHSAAVAAPPIETSAERVAAPAQLQTGQSSVNAPSVLLSQDVVAAQQQLSASRSSSSGMPSALAVPFPADHAAERVTAPNALGTSDTVQEKQPHQQQHQQQKVRWSLPDDEDSKGPAGRQHSQQATAAGAGQGSSASKPSIGRATGAPRAVVGNIRSSLSPYSSRLPLSGSEQLDKYLRYLLQENHPHKFMYYPNWGLTGDGCAAIGEFLRRDKIIKVMTISGNDIRDDGAELIAEALATNHCLVTLDMSSNKISDAGAIALAEALHRNKCLAELQLNNNRIGDEGAEALAAAVASSRTIKKLHVQGNLITAAQLQVVQHVLKTRQYKMPNKQPSASNLRAHLRKNSSFLQFHIELSDSEDVIKTAARHRLQLPPATAILALSEPIDPLEESLSTQVAHLTAELDANNAGGTPVLQSDESAGIVTAAIEGTSGAICNRAGIDAADCCLCLH